MSAELLAEIERAGLAPWARARLRELVEREDRKAQALAALNDEKSQRIARAILRAADRHLVDQIRIGVTSPRWPGLLRQYLERRLALYGLERWPCLRTIRTALKDWAPPNGSTSGRG